MNAHVTAKTLSTAGRLILVAVFLAFGTQHFIYARTGTGFGSPWTPENHIIACLAGVIFILAAAGLAAGQQIRLMAILIGSCFLLRAALVYLPRIAVNPRDADAWTNAFELLAIAGASFVLARSRPASPAPTELASGPTIHSPGSLLHTGRGLFAASLVVFGIQHLMYGRYVASLIPSWIPAHLTWAYLTGIAFFATALSIVTGILTRLAATLLGTMFLIWVIILHAPRVAAAPHNADEWTSLLVALGMSGGAFVIAGVGRRSTSHGLRTRTLY